MTPLKNFQKKIGVADDGVFGKNTLCAGAEFLKLSPLRAAHFFAQCSHETAGFVLFEENLNYSANALRRVFGKYFPGDLAERYAHLPEKIANRVYADRMGNGNELSGDGWKYRGRGALQLTGKSNYESFFRSINNPGLISSPEVVVTDYAIESAIWFFDKNGLWDICIDIHKQTIEALTRKINGGTNGLDDRIVKTRLYLGWMQ